ncbi:MAG TPA: DUF4388 domain-containing protein [Myxococcota bacterium]|nr:DUF4388 domain-containing protein [Myxococcota bacterium]
MSLVGSLEDLGLGEILQIVSLSGKSGVLHIRSRDGEGRILFRSGMIRGALVKDGPRDLCELLAAAGALPAAELEALHREAQAEGAPLEALLAARTALDGARIDELRERHVETTVLRMFSWQTGDFSFEIRDEPGEGEVEELLLRAGLNAQFLALEGTRLRDEGRRPEPGADDLAAEPEEIEGPVELQITVLELVDEELGTDALPEALPDDGPSLDDEPTLTEGKPRAPVAEAVPVASAKAPPVEPEGTSPPRLEDAVVVAVDRELAALEWIKRALAQTSARVHIFQRSEEAINRIRQYVARAEFPIVVLTTATPPDPVSGARDWSEIAARLRAQVPQVPIVLLAAPGAPVVPVSERAIPDALATRPDLTVLSDERARERRESLGSELRGALGRARSKQAAPRSAARAPESGEALRGLREVSARLRDPSSRGDVLRLVIDYAAGSFERVAIFMVRDGEAQGVAQIGMAAAGGPDDVDLRTIRFPAEEPGWFRKVAASRAPLRASPGDEGDRDLANRLGREQPGEVYVAPIESGQRVVAILYADNLPSRRPLPDSSALEVVLHEAGLALERAVLERALEEAEGERKG